MAQVAGGPVREGEVRLHQDERPAARELQPRHLAHARAPVVEGVPFELDLAHVGAYKHRAAVGLVVGAR